MLLVIFDIDGTLVHTIDGAADCFFEVLERHTGGETNGRGIGDFDHVTDEGIARQMLAEAGRVDDVEETLKVVRTEYTRELEARLAPETVHPVDGAPDFVDWLLASSDHQVGVATGNWHPTAELKLNLIGVDHGPIPMGTSSDSHRRHEILSAAYERGARTAPSDLSGAVYVGDGEWDLKVARHLDMGFVGVGSGKHGRKLESAGAERLVSDFNDRNSVIRSLREAAV